MPNAKNLHAEKEQIGQRATAPGIQLNSFEVGAMPIINRILKRMRLSEILRESLPTEDDRTLLPTHRALVLMVCNVLISRQPIYGVGRWAAQFAPDLLNLFRDEVELLNDDRVGRCLDRLRDGLTPDLIMHVVRHVVKEFRINLDELHNDSTTVSFFGNHLGDETVRTERGSPTLAITHGHSKDHRPDLKQLLYILTVSNDGGVPIFFTAENGNTTDDTTHQATWDLLRELVGRPDFLYVADCKLATTNNMNYIAQRGGRFVTVLPKTRKEDRQFRDRAVNQPDSLAWQDVYKITKTILVRGQEMEKTIDALTVCSDEMISHEGYRLLWFRSTRKQ